MQNKLRHEYGLTLEHPWTLPGTPSPAALPLAIKCRDPLDRMMQLRDLFPDLDCADTDAQMTALLQLHVALAGVLGEGQEQARKVLVKWAVEGLQKSDRARALLLVFAGEDNTPLPEAKVCLIVCRNIILKNRCFNLLRFDTV